MGLGRLAAALALALSALPVAAQPRDVPAPPRTEAPATALYEALGLPEMIAIMRQEGLAQAGEVAIDWLPFQPGPGWSAAVDAIYDRTRMGTVMRQAFEAALRGSDISALTAFFAEPLGDRIIALEVEARRAFLDPATEEAARQMATDPDLDADRLAKIEAYIDANDLVEFNVEGALNSNYRFFLGLAEAGAIAMTEDEILTEVWAQEEETRKTTREWLRGFLLLAYEPLTEAELERYVALSRTEAGQLLNRALFQGFGEMYDTIYHALGLALARQMQSEDL